MKKFIALMMSLAMCLSLLAGCGSSGGNDGNAPADTQAPAGTQAPADTQAPQEGGDAAATEVALDGSWPAETVKIGMEVYDTTDEQFLALQTYFDYLETCFNVDFIYSESLSAAEDELAFIDSCASAGCQAILGYYNIAGAEAIKEATSQGMYYWGTEQYYGDVKDDEYYIGTYTFVDANDAEAHNGDYLAGYELGYALGTQGCQHVKYCSGGASFGIQMFIDRQEGFFAGIEAAQAEGATIVCDPTTDVLEGWPGTDDFAAGQSATLTADYDAVASSFNVAMWFQPVMESGKDIKLAAIGEANDTYKTFVDMGVVTALVYDCEETVFGNAFASIMNAVTGHIDLTRNEDGSPRLQHTARWTLTDPETFNAVYDYHAAGNFFASAEQVASCLGELNPDATTATMDEVYDLTLEEAVAMTK